MHERAMLLLKREQSQNVCDYAPIARSLFRMDSETEAKLKKKFELAYVIAKENFSFTKMKPLCQLEEKHGIDLGESYKNDMACSTFIDYIGRDFREALTKTLQEAHFYSIQMDGSTDCANVEEELFLAIYFDPKGEDGSVHVRSRLMCVRQPESVDAPGLYRCFNRAVAYLGLDSMPNKLVGFGCDGASVNMGPNALRGCLQSDKPWIVTFWCMAHRLKLSLKDALHNTLFATIDDILLRMYYLYSKAPKKCRELEVIVTELRACLDQSELPRTGGNRPIRACGTRFIAHKVAALERFIDRFGVYLNHITSLTEDPSVKSADKQKLKGYIIKWKDSKVLLGSALFHDILRPAAILCKALQSDELSVVNCIEAILRTSTGIEKLKSTEMEEFPSVKKVLLRIRLGEGTSTSTDSEHTYQGTELTKYKQGLDFLKSHKNEYIEQVLLCLKDRIKDRDTSESELLTNALKIVATHGWEKTEDASFGYSAIENLSTRFEIPLQEAGVNCAVLQDEWDDIVYHAKQYLNLVTDSCRVVWWKLFNSPDSCKWTNILTLVELIFTLPLSNGQLERYFSMLKIIKTNRRSCLGEDRLDNLIRIQLEGPPLQQWDPSQAVECWWTDKSRRIDSQAGKRTSMTTSSTSKDSDFTWNLSDWESWLEHKDTNNSGYE